MLHTGLIASVSDLLERHRKERPDKVAYWDAVRSVTYSQLAGRTARMAAGLETTTDDAARWVRWSAPVDPRPEWLQAAGERYQRWCQELPAGP